MNATATAETTELETLLAQIRGKDTAELAQADSFSRIMYGKPIDVLDLKKARSLADSLQRARYELAHPAAPGYCFECGVKCGRSQCQACKEGMTRGEYSRTYRRTQWGLE